MSDNFITSYAKRSGKTEQEVEQLYGGLKRELLSKGVGGDALFTQITGIMNKQLQTERKEMKEMKLIDKYLVTEKKNSIVIDYILKQVDDKEVLKIIKSLASINTKSANALKQLKSVQKMTFNWEKKQKAGVLDFMKGLNAGDDINKNSGNIARAFYDTQDYINFNRKAGSAVSNLSPFKAKV